MEKAKVLKTLHNSLKMYANTLSESLERGSEQSIKLTLDELVRLKGEIEKVESTNENDKMFDEKEIIKTMTCNAWLMKLPKPEFLLVDGLQELVGESEINQSEIVGFYIQGENLVVNISDSTALPIFVLEAYKMNNFKEKNIVVDYIDDTGVAKYTKTFKNVKFMEYNQITADSHTSNQGRVFSLVFSFEEVELSGGIRKVGNK